MFFEKGTPPAYLKFLSKIKSKSPAKITFLSWNPEDLSTNYLGFLLLLTVPFQCWYHINL